VDGGLAAVLHLPVTTRRVPCVVACHGLGASKESDKYLLLGDAVPAAGFALARFDFRGCGESSGVETDTTIASRIEDVFAVLAALERHPSLSGRFGFLGSSLGGFVALHVAARRADAPPVVTWNAPADLRDLPPPTSPSGLGPAFFAEVQAGAYACAPGVPYHLVVQSALDDVVPPEHGARLHARARAPRKLVTIAGGDHRLSDPDHRAQAIAASVEWFTDHLGREALGR
jgi:fermentation-respiration switch protein FrsA (DUF1100 family)